MSVSPLPVYEAQSSRPKVRLGYRVAPPSAAMTARIKELVLERFPTIKFDRFKTPADGDKETEDYHATMAYGLDANNYAKCKEFMETKAGLTTDDLIYPVLDAKNPETFDAAVGTRMNSKKDTVIVRIEMKASAKYIQAKQHIRKEYLPADQTAFGDNVPHITAMYAETTPVPSADAAAAAPASASAHAPASAAASAAATASAQPLASPRGFKATQKCVEEAAVIGQEIAEKIMTTGVSGHFDN